MFKISQNFKSTQYMFRIFDKLRVFFRFFRCHF